MDERKHPEVVAYELRKARKPGPAEVVDAAASRRVCLTMNSGRFRLRWSASSIGDNDWVGLYASISASDSDYIGGAWQWASKANVFDTSIPVQPNYQARYLVWSAAQGKYVSVARTGAFPSVTMQSVPSSYPRKPTSSEWSGLKYAFPGLQQGNVWVTGPQTPLYTTGVTAYNCIAWSLGFDDRWINPDSPLAAFEIQYNAYGKTTTSRLDPNAGIDGWGIDPSNTTHGSKTYTGTSVGTGGLWESKLGQNVRITHGRTELSGTTYGTVLASFLAGSYAVTVEAWEMAAIEPLEENEMVVLREKIAALPPDFRNKFESAFAAWEATWFQGKLAYSSNTRDLAQGDAYKALVGMGPAILPLLVEKLCDPAMFPALVLYDALQGSPELVLTYKAGDPYRLEGEQARARRTVRRWIAVHQP